ncbi:MAG: response regulator [Gammaproteobacteria bacterium SHHR-1]
METDNSLDDDDKPTLLIVDDEPANLRVLSLVLQGEYRVRAARSGQDALNLLETPPKPDVVLLDIMMPEMDGYATLRKIRDKGYSDLPVIFVTALDGELDEQRGLQIGAADYITKPIRPAIVRARIKTQLKLKEAREHLNRQVAKRTQELHEANNGLRQSLIETVRSFSIMLENRAPAMAGHSKRVADTARRVAAKLGLPERERNDIVFAALLSRVGAITLPSKILERPLMGLTKPERDELMIAVIRTRQIFRNIRPLVNASEIIANQFERYDGSGFPRRLVGEDIPLGARILAVCRDFDLYLEGMFDSKKHLVPEAKDFLRRKSGLFFDPNIAEIYSNMVGRMRKVTRPLFDVGLADVVEGQELAEVRFGDEIFVRDTLATKPLLRELQDVMNETGLYCAIKIRAKF